MMLMRRISFFLVILGFAFVTPLTSYGQGQTPPEPAIAQQQPLSKEQEQEKLKLESKAVTLLEQVVSETPALKLPENRIRVQIAAGDMLWARDQARARGLFSDAGAAIAQMTWQADRGDSDGAETTAQLRRELVLTAALHDADLAFQLLSSTRPQARTNSAANDTRIDSSSDTSLDQSLLSMIASTDPKVAYRKALESLDRGEYPAGVGSVLRQLHSKDKEAFEKLSKKLLSKLTTDNLIASEEAGNVAVDLLRPGPIPEDPTGRSTNTHSSNASGQNQALGESAYHDLMDAAITAALTAVPNITPRAQDAITFMTRDAIMVIGDDARAGFFLQPISATQPNDERQDNTRTLLTKLQQLLPQIDQYLPDRARAMRQKLTELGISNNQITSIDLDQGTSESLMTAARLAPLRIQSQIYKQAAQKAIGEGNTERALQIATDHLDESERNAITKQIELKRTAMDASPDKLAKIRQRLAALPSDSARVATLIDLAIATEKDNPKLALTFLDDASNIVGRRASNYHEFEDQLKVAEALAALDPKRSFEMLELGIAHLNEILAAAAVVNGFEAEVFREGELPLQGGSELGKMVARYGWELGSLAKLDFDHARMTADKFQLPESRLLARLLIAQRVLGGQQNSFDNKLRDSSVQIFSISAR
jgi:hypothetical protein